MKADMAIAGILSRIAVAAFAISAADLYKSGSAFFDKGQFAEAAQAFQQARALAPRDARIAKALGVSFAAMNDYERANQPLEQACLLDSSLEDACYFSGRNLYALNRFEPALKALNKGLRSTRQPWRVHLGIAQAHEGLGEPQNAEPAFRKAIAEFEALPPSHRGRPDFDPRVHYSTFLYRQGRLDEALAAARKVTKDNPQYGRGHYEVGRILRQQGKLQDAASSLERAIAGGAGAPAHLLLGQIYLTLGRQSDAERHLSAGASSQPAP